MACFKHGKHDTDSSFTRNRTSYATLLWEKKDRTADLLQYREEKVSNSCTDYVIAAEAKGHKHWH
jgi:hypothetical protein